jgi:hypothetical protein
MAPAAVLAFGISPDTPYDSTPVQVNAQSIVVRKGEIARVSVPLSSGDIHIVTQQAFSPATVLHNQDPRTLAVQLRGVEQLH